MHKLHYGDLIFYIFQLYMKCNLYPTEYNKDTFLANGHVKTIPETHVRSGKLYTYNRSSFT